MWTFPSNTGQAEIMNAAHEGGLGGAYGNVPRFLSPLTVNDDLLHDEFDVLAAALEKTR